MTIVEEIDKKSGRPHRSRNIVEALKYLFDLDKTPRNISEAVKGYSGGGSGITYETIYEGNFEFVGKAPNVSAYEFEGTEELFNKLVYYTDLYDLQIGDDKTRSCVSQGVFVNNMHHVVGDVDNNFYFDIYYNENTSKYAGNITTAQPAGTYSVTLKKIILPE